MTTSGTYNFSMDIDEVIQEAIEMIGGEQTLGHEPKSARRSINLLLQDWQNRGILLWTANTTTVSVSTSVTAYELPNSTVDVLEVVLNRDNPVMYVWPIPENTTDLLKIEQVKYTQDVNKSAIQTADISRRFYPCLTAGLSYFMSMKRPGVEGGRIQFLKTEYEERLARAMDEDRERASLRIVPNLNRV